MTEKQEKTAGPSFDGRRWIVKPAPKPKPKKVAPKSKKEWIILDHRQRGARQYFCARYCGLTTKSEAHKYSKTEAETIVRTYDNVFMRPA